MLRHGRFVLDHLSLLICLQPIMSSVPSQSAQSAPPNLVSQVHRRATTRNFFLLLLLAFLLFARFAGSMLVRDQPEKSDVIVVLAGDSQDERYRRGMELLRAGNARHLLLDASSDSRYFGHTPAEYAEAFLRQDAKNKDMSSQVSVCAFELDSTLTETGYVGKCLEPFHPAAVLLVTSDWHTMRARPFSCTIFRNIIGPWPPPKILDSSAHTGGVVVNGPRLHSMNG